MNYCDCIFFSQPPHWISFDDFKGLMSFYKRKGSEYCYHDICVIHITPSLIKDVRAYCFCASLLRTKIHTPRHT